VKKNFAGIKKKKRKRSVKCFCNFLFKLLKNTEMDRKKDKHILKKREERKREIFVIKKFEDLVNINLLLPTCRYNKLIKPPPKKFLRFKKKSINRKKSNKRKLYLFCSR
jgi:hypothetical protein